MINHKLRVLYTGGFDVNVIHHQDRNYFTGDWENLMDTRITYVGTDFYSLIDGVYEYGHKRTDSLIKITDPEGEL